ncbi:MAG: hypothetical protein QM783_06955 [Phycisphaerales bacterium]
MRFLWCGVFLCAVFVLAGCHAGPPDGVFDGVGDSFAPATPAAFVAPAGFVPLFDGRTLTGWKGLVEPDKGPPRARR